jgi:hypothetical protein
METFFIMADCDHTQIFTVFGGSYVGERHGSSPLSLNMPKEGKSGRFTRAGVALGLLAVGLTTAAAMTAPRMLASCWSYNPHATKVVAGFEEALY